MGEILELMILVENVYILIISKRIRDNNTYNFDSFFKYFFCYFLVLIIYMYLIFINLE